VNARQAFEIAKQSFAEWSEDGATRLAAALAYYTVFSLAPLIFIVVALIGLVYADADAMVREQIANLLGEDTAAFLADTAQQSGPEGGVVATLIGIAVLLFGAAGVFGQLQDSLNTIWDVRSKPGQGIMGFVRARFFSFALVGGTAFLLLVSLIATTALQAAIDWLETKMPGIGFLWTVLNFAISVGATTVIFAIIFKVVPDAVVQWRDVWGGALLTGLLFSAGQILLGLYLGRQADNSVYGAAGSLIVVLLWVYYSAQILFFGAEFTQVTAKRRGAPIVPARNAVRIDEAARAAQGIPAVKTGDGEQRAAVPESAAYLAGFGVGRALRGRFRR
jgi:membrane protein